ncbi:MAG: recombinase family protein, partial [Pseudomonadota bacterium]
MPPARLIGYARVSTGEQTTDPQEGALRAAGCARIFRDTASGAARARPQLARALEMLAPGDVLVIARLDRLARSLSHLLEIVEGLEARGVGFRSLGDPIDTTSAQGRLTLQILGAVAEFERQLIRERTKAGLASAAAEGRRGGNPALRTGDRGGLAKLAHARDMSRTDAVLDAAPDLVPLIRELRPAASWDRVLRVLTARGSVRPWDGRPWTRDSLIRAARRLARDGLIPEQTMARARRGPEDKSLTALVAAIWGALPRPTLAACARQLETQYIRTPRGGTRWSPSSVKNILDRARDEGLVRDRPA